MNVTGSVPWALQRCAVIPYEPLLPPAKYRFLMYHQFNFEGKIHDKAKERHANAEVKIDRKRFTIIIGILLLSVLVAVLILRDAKNNPIPPITDISLCDQDPRELCIVTFGTTSPDQMVINFQLPEEDYPVFQVKGLNRGMTYDYSCNIEEAVPTSVFCTGPRTPLGEYIELEVYSVAENFLLARGKILISAIMVWTPSGMADATPPNESPIATAATGTTVPTQTFVIPTQIFVTAYPNPPLPGTAYPNP